MADIEFFSSIFPFAIHRARDDFARMSHAISVNKRATDEYSIPSARVYISGGLVSFPPTTESFMTGSLFLCDTLHEILIDVNDFIRFFRIDYLHVCLLSGKTRVWCTSKPACL